MTTIEINLLRIIEKERKKNKRTLVFYSLILSADLEGRKAIGPQVPQIRPWQGTVDAVSKNRGNQNTAQCFLSKVW